MLSTANSRTLCWNICSSSESTVSGAPAVDSIVSVGIAPRMISPRRGGWGAPLKVTFTYSVVDFTSEIVIFTSTAREFHEQQRDFRESAR